MIRSKRKTMALRITAQGVPEVRAPLRFPKSAIDQWVQSKESWIREKTALARVRQEEKETFSLAFGKKALLLGTEYPIQLRGFMRILFIFLLISREMISSAV